jgi:hypothetical protein
MFGGGDGEGNFIPNLLSIGEEEIVDRGTSRVELPQV